MWTRPGLDRRSRSIATLTALLALRHWGEFAMHVRAARTNGLSDEEIAEVILQSAVYCGVPVANHGFAVAREVLEEPGRRCLSSPHAPSRAPASASSAAGRRG
nr:carboxymuconolactone decarboxylase family protein [Nocardioides convexus]